MCGRVFQTMNTNTLLRLAGTTLIRNGDRYAVNNNVCPTSNLPAIRYNSSPEYNYRSLDIMRWGYQTPFLLLINCRSEELLQKPLFRPLLNKNRCVVIIEGFYDWNAQKQPYAFKPLQTKKDIEEEKPAHFYVAALYSNDESLIILTRESTNEVNVVHHRMPVFLDEDEIDMWLDCDKYKFEKIFDNIIMDETKAKWKNLTFYPVGFYVNDVKNKTEQCLMTIEDYKKKLDETGIKRFFGVKKSQENDSKTNHANKEEVKGDDKSSAKVKEYAKDSGVIKKDGIKDIDHKNRSTSGDKTNAHKESPDSKNLKSGEGIDLKSIPSKIPKITEKTAFPGKRKNNKVLDSETYQISKIKDPSSKKTKVNDDSSKQGKLKFRKVGLEKAKKLAYPNSSESNLHEIS